MCTYMSKLLVFPLHLFPFSFSFPILLLVLHTYNYTLARMLVNEPPASVPRQIARAYFPARNAAPGRLMGWHYNAGLRRAIWTNLTRYVVLLTPT